MARRRRNGPISQVEIEEDLLRLMEELEEQTEGFEDLALKVAKAEATYDCEWAKSYLNAGGTVEERKAWATYNTQEEARQFKIAEALLRARRERLTSIRGQIEALRTLNGNIRALL